MCPVISTASYIIVEKHAGSGWIWLPVDLTFIYGMMMLYLNGIRMVRILSSGFMTSVYQRQYFGCVYCWQ